MSGPLTDSQLDQAVTYNQKRPYSKALWQKIQQTVAVTADGVPGPETAQAAAVYQAAHGLAVDGKVGPGTLAAMQLGCIFTLPGKAPFFFLAPLEIDADGAPDAYNPQNTGIDYLRNAGEPGNWWGIATDSSGTPYIQGADDPCPGYYVSTTALVTSSHCPGVQHPSYYVDSEQIDFIVLPSNLSEIGLTGGVRKGDIALVLRTDNPMQRVYAIYADVGPACTLDPTSPTHLGEGSIKLSQDLGNNPFVRDQHNVLRASCGIASGVFTVVFPGSGCGTALSPDEISERGEAAFASWGGETALAEALSRVGSPRVASL